MSEKSIAQLESEVALHRSRLIAAEQKLRAAKLAAAPVKIGDVVRCTRSGNLFRVALVDVKWRKPLVQAHPKKKNGEWGTATRHLYDNWEIVTDDQ